MILNFGLALIAAAATYFLYGATARLATVPRSGVEWLHVWPVTQTIEAPRATRRYRRMPNASWLALLIACLMCATVLSAILESILQ